MRKVSMLIGICMLVALALTLVAQGPPDLSPIMKDVGATNGKLTMDIMAGVGADVAADAAKSLLEGVVNERAALDYKSVHEPVRLMAIEGFEQMIARFTTDIPYLPNLGQPLLIGPGSILDAHTEHERVKQDDLVGAVTIYSDLVRRLLKHE